MKTPLCLALLAAMVPSAAQRLVVTETAGIRRFNYPVNAKLPGGVTVGRLLEDGKAVPAQFGDGEVDFGVSLGPFEKREYTVESGAAAAPGATVREEGEHLVVGYTPSLQWVVPRNLLGFLHAVRTPRWDYLRPGSMGLYLRYRDDIIYRAGGAGPYGAPTKVRIVKQGQFATVLEFTGTEALRGGRSVASTVWMEFPRTKSWVKASWRIEDPDAFVTGQGLELNLNLAAEPVLVDFGGGSMVYGRLQAGQGAALAADPKSWRVVLGPAAGMEPYVSGRGVAEGWAHVMDRERATAAALEDFGRRSDRIEAFADGRLRIFREHAGAGTKTLTFWLHFVSMPVQVGAATSPQSMLAPLKVEVQ
jgi:hypothetical protein